MLLNVGPNIGHCITDGLVIVEHSTVLASIPLLETRKLGGDCAEKANNNTNWDMFHFFNEFNVL